MSIYRFKGKRVDLEQMRTELQTMGQDELLRFIEALTSAKANGQATDNNFTVPFEEARAEWKRRHSSI